MAKILLDSAGLQHYDAKIKGYMEGRLQAVLDALAGALRLRGVLKPEPNDEGVIEVVMDTVSQNPSVGDTYFFKLAATSDGKEQNAVVYYHDESGAELSDEVQNGDAIICTAERDITVTPNIPASWAILNSNWAFTAGEDGQTIEFTRDKINAIDLGTLNGVPLKFNIPTAQSAAYQLEESLIERNFVHISDVKSEENTGGTITTSINTESPTDTLIPTEKAVSEYVKKYTGEGAITKIDLVERMDGDTSIGIEITGGANAGQLDIPAATKNLPGVMTGKDKIYLDSAITAEDFGNQNIEGENLYAYGIEFDTEVSSPECTRIGNMNLHRTLPVHSQMKGCLLDDTGVVKSYLPESDWTSAVRDGSEGQVMVEIPEHWRKFVENGTKRQVWYSTMPLSGYHRVPKMYVGAYEAAVDRTDSAKPKLASVVNTSEEFRGGSNTGDWDGTYRSLLGMPATSISRTNFRNYARNRNGGDSRWNCYLYEAHKSLYWLFVVEYATLNSQKAYNGALTTEGYRQGGLGNCVTNLNGATWNEYNGYNPFVPCGYTDILGNGTGEMAFQMPSEYGTLTTYVPRYRGIENPFGHTWKWSDGINVRISPTTANGGDDLSKVYVCSDPQDFSDSGYTGYSYIGDEARGGGYAKKHIFGDGGEMIPSATGGGSTTYLCDYHYTNIPTTVSLRGVLFGGDAIRGANAGFVFAASDYVPSTTHASIGSRLCFKHE